MKKAILGLFASLMLLVIAPAYGQSQNNEEVPPIDNVRIETVSSGWGPQVSFTQPMGGPSGPSLFGQRTDSQFGGADVELCISRGRSDGRSGDWGICGGQTGLGDSFVDYRRTDTVTFEGVSAPVRVGSSYSFNNAKVVFLKVYKFLPFVTVGRGKQFFQFGITAGGGVGRVSGDALKVSYRDEVLFVDGFPQVTPVERIEEISARKAFQGISDISTPILGSLEGTIAVGSDSGTKGKASCGYMFQFGELRPVCSFGILQIF